MRVRSIAVALFGLVLAGVLAGCAASEVSSKGADESQKQIEAANKKAGAENPDQPK